jgi:small RNA 2'-O-methyltransferase
MTETSKMYFSKGDRVEDAEEEEDNSGDLPSKNFFRFVPPLYYQRYEFVSQLLLKNNCKTYLDIGCAECKLLKYLKSSNKQLNLIVGLDIDENLMIQSSERMRDAFFDFIFAREEPLDIYLFKGDIAKPSQYFIDKLCAQTMQLDCVSLIEIIEHLRPDTLKQCIRTVFGLLKPKLIVMTTPNYEFNVVFNIKDDDTGNTWNGKV